MKKYMAFLLAILMICMLPVDAVAVTIEEQILADGVIETQVATLTRDVLCFIEPEKELYGMGDINFSTLQLGKQLPVYILQENGVGRETKILYFPILSGLDWVATSIVSYDSAGKMNVQVSMDYAKAYKDSNARGADISLLFDDDHAYIVTNKEVIEAATAPNKVEGRADVVETQRNIQTMQIEKVPLEAIYTLGMSANSRDEANPFNNQYCLMVPSIVQAAGSNQCWAASVASILGYYGRTTTIAEVYSKLGWDIDDDQGGTIHNAAAAIGGFGYTNLNWYMLGLNWYELRTEIYISQNPLFAMCDYGDTGYGHERYGHAVVIRGFYVYKNISQVGIISYMDPVNGEYMASSVATDGDYYYIHSGSSTQYPMVGFWSVSDY